MLIDTGPSRPEGTLRGLLFDLFAPCHESDWNRRVNDERIRHVDRTRPYLTRAALQVALTILMAAMPGTSRATVLLMLPGLLQVMVEIATEPLLRHTRPSRGDVALPWRPVVAVWFAAYERVPVNLTGLIGAVAVPANIAAAVWFTGVDAPAWLRILALIVATLYLNSAVLGVMLDTSWYSPLDRTPRILERLRAWTWIILTGVHALTVASAEWWGSRWGDQLPVALMSSGLIFYIGLRMREYERSLRAAARVMRRASSQQRSLMARELHNLFQPAKSRLRRLVQAADLPSHEKAAMTGFLFDMEDMYKYVKNSPADPDMVVSPPFRYRVETVLESAAINSEGSIYELDGKLDTDNERFARATLTTLLDNARAAYHANIRAHSHPRVVVTMTLQDDTAVVAVADNTPPVPERRWCRSGDTIHRLREDLRLRGGDLVQEPHADGGKTVRATWPIHLGMIRGN